MSTFFEDAAAYKALVDVLRVLLTGDSAASVVTEGGTKPSISKFLADNLRDYVRAAGDRQGFANKTIMDANLNFDGGVLVEVTNDATDENNGLWRKEGVTGQGYWVKARTDKYTYLQGQFDDMALLVQSELEKINVHQYDPATKLADDNGVPKAYSVNDEQGFAAFLIDMLGRLEINGMQFERQVDANPLELLDESGRLAMAIGSLGELMMGCVSVLQTDANPYPLSVADELNRVIFALGRRGQVVLPGVDIEVVDDVPNYIFVLRDVLGRVAFAIDKNGCVTFRAAPEMGESSSGQPVAAVGEIIPADDMQFFSYGQSLSRGATAYPVVSLEQSFNNVTFSGGVLSRDGGAYDLTGFKPLVEEQLGAEGETPTSGALNEISARMGSDYTDNNFRFIGSAPGRGGRAIDQLNKGSEYYQYLIEHVQSASDVCQGEGRSHNLQCVFWTQGEANYSSSNFLEMDVYERKLSELHHDISLDAQLITGQKFMPVFISYQVAAHRRYGNDYPEIAMAQLNASHNNEQIYVACPMYFAEYGGDNLHLTSEGSLWLGKYYGKAYHHVVNLGQDWRPVQPKSVTAQGKIIEVLFHMPQGGRLEFDTAWVAAAPNMGFDIYDGLRGSMQDIIVSVELSGPNRVRIVLGVVPDSGARLTYAHGRAGDPGEASRLTGPRGNLRDNAGDNDHYTDSNGVERLMHNWCVMFDEVLSN
ncbi:MAG: sialate O-acetylesterase [Bermanella sp.]